MDEETITAPAESGNGTESPPQATETPSQEVSQPQHSATEQVEPVVSAPQEQESSRRRPSDYYRERQWKRRLEDTVTSLAQRQEELLSFLKEQKAPSGDPQKSGKFDLEKFFSDPQTVLTELEKALLAEIDKVRSEVQGWKAEQSKSQAVRVQQEALELLFPKSKDGESLEVRVNKDPERTERILEILKEPGVIQLFESNPQRAVRFILAEAGEGVNPKPTVLPKKLMGGVAKGNPTPGGGKKAMTEEDLRSELRKLRDEADKSPQVRFDPEWRKKKETIMRDLERVLTEEKRD